MSPRPSSRCSWSLGGLASMWATQPDGSDISEVKAYIAAARLNLPAGAPGKDGTPTATISLEPGALEPVMTEIKALGESLAELQQRVNSNPGGPDLRRQAPRRQVERGASSEGRSRSAPDETGRNNQRGQSPQRRAGLRSPAPDRDRGFCFRLQRRREIAGRTEHGQVPGQPRSTIRRAPARSR